MFTRGEVGAGIIFIALGYNLGGPHWSFPYLHWVESYSDRNICPLGEKLGFKEL